MLNFEGMETIESTIYRISSNLCLKNIVKFGKSEYTTNIRKDALYSKDVRTVKYSDVSVLKNIYLETSDFLVFSYTNRNSEGKFIIEDVYISYPHIYKLKNKLSIIYKKIKDDKLNSKKKEPDINKLIFTKVDNKRFNITSKYEDYKLNIDNLVNGRCIVVLFDIMEKETPSGFKDEKAVRLVINKPENFVLLDYDQFESLFMFINEFNLLGSSQNLINFSYMTRITDSLGMISDNIKFVNANGKVNQRIIPNIVSDEKEEKEQQ